MSNTSNTSKSQRSQDSPEPKGSNDNKDTAAQDLPKPMEILRHARAQLAELTGLTPESVSSFEQTEDGWILEVEVLEVVRVPDTMSLLATYQVELDHQGDLTGYRRIRRYERGRADSRRSGGR
ncbi:gas vesicle protein GvpO [Streptomyces sp. NPDC059785]|uniref:gas vesicle protein GvpO n=1 Tax=unclassified Streptomyces TaxID=2593676 RepID=UPI0036697E15